MKSILLIGFFVATISCKTWNGIVPSDGNLSSIPTAMMPKGVSLKGTFTISNFDLEPKSTQKIDEKLAFHENVLSIDDIEMVLPIGDYKNWWVLYDGSVDDVPNEIKLLINVVEIKDDIVKVNLKFITANGRYSEFKTALQFTKRSHVSYKDNSSRKSLKLTITPQASQITSNNNKPFFVEKIDKSTKLLNLIECCECRVQMICKNGSLSSGDAYGQASSFGLGKCDKIDDESVKDADYGCYNKGGRKYISNQHCNVEESRSGYGCP